MVNHFEIHVNFQDIEHQFFLRNLHKTEKYFLSTQNYLLEAFTALLNHINYLHPNIEYTTILYFYHNLYVFVNSFCRSINRVTYSSSNTSNAINNISISVKRSNFTLVFFKAACHAYPGAERNLSGSSSYISIHTFLKFSNTSANKNVLL